jgi:hypothetical protein
MFLNKFVSLLLVISVITLSVFSGVETSAVVIRSASSLSGLSPVLGLITVTVRGNLPETAYKTLTVTVTKNPDDDGALRITTVADVSTPENTDKVITLITNKSAKRPIVIRIFGYGYSKGFVSRLGKVPFEPPVKATLKDSDINTISIIPRLLMFLRLKTQTR